MRDPWPAPMGAGLALACAIPALHFFCKIPFTASEMRAMLSYPYANTATIRMYGDNDLVRSTFHGAAHLHITYRRGVRRLGGMERGSVSLPAAGQTCLAASFDRGISPCPGCLPSERLRLGNFSSWPRLGALRGARLGNFPSWPGCLPSGRASTGEFPQLAGSTRGSRGGMPSRPGRSHGRVGMSRLSAPVPCPPARDRLSGHGGRACHLNLPLLSYTPRPGDCAGIIS